MCLIIYRPAGIELDRDTLLAAGHQNRDGVGVMWCRDGVIHTRRSMDVTQVFKFIEEAGDDVPIGIHFRWATHGAKTLENCHPLKVTNDMVMMHNGVLPVYDKDNVLSDTTVYAKRVLRPLIKATPSLAADPSFALLIKMSAGSSNKFLFVQNDGETGYWWMANEKLGSWHDGAWFSSYVNRGTYASNTHYYGEGRGSHWWDQKTSTTTASTPAATVTRGSEDTAPLGASAEADDLSSSERASVADIEEQSYHNWERASSGYGETDDGHLGAMARQIEEAREIVAQYRDSLLIPEEELHGYLMEEYGYDMASDRLVGAAAVSGAIV